MLKVWYNSWSWKRASSRSSFLISKRRDDQHVHTFSEERVRKGAEKLAKFLNAKQQGRLDGFFTVQQKPPAEKADKDKSKSKETGKGKGAKRKVCFVQSTWSWCSDFGRHTCRARRQTLLQGRKRKHSPGGIFRFCSFLHPSRPISRTRCCYHRNTTCNSMHTVEHENACLFWECSYTFQLRSPILYFASVISPSNLMENSPLLNVAFTSLDGSLQMPLVLRVTSTDSHLGPSALDATPLSALLSCVFIWTGLVSLFEMLTSAGVCKPW